MDQAAAVNENVVSVVASNDAFAALKSDGSVISFGRQDSGGDSSAVLSDLQSDVVSIFAGDHSFAALKTDGSLVTWAGSTKRW